MNGNGNSGGPDFSLDGSAPTHPGDGGFGSNGNGNPGGPDIGWNGSSPGNYPGGSGTGIGNNPGSRPGTGIGTIGGITGNRPGSGGFSGNLGGNGYANGNSGGAYYGGGTNGGYGGLVVDAGPAAWGTSSPTSISRSGTRAQSKQDIQCRKILNNSASYSLHAVSFCMQR